VIQFDVSTLLKSQFIDNQIHVIEKTIRPLFADLVTITVAIVLHLVISSDNNTFTVKKDVPKKLPVPETKCKF